MVGVNVLAARELFPSVLASLDSHAHVLDGFTSVTGTQADDGL